MKIQMNDTVTPRCDGVHAPLGITLGKVYEVAEILHDKYSIINDNMKIARYLKIRFRVVDDTPVLALRDNFNTLTSQMRSKIKELEKELETIKITRTNINRVEVIDETGRAYTNCAVTNIEFSMQDENKTLKLFLKTKKANYDFTIKQD